MDTHELSKALTVLAKALRASPNVEIDNICEIVGGRSGKRLGTKEIRVGLSHLVALSRVDKKKWMELIKEYNFPVDVRPRDSSRDILGKLLKYLENTPEARERIKMSTYQAGIKASPQLMKALDSLLRE
jgi:hypothetical protein